MSSRTPAATWLIAAGSASAVIAALWWSSPHRPSSTSAPSGHVRDEGQGEAPLILGQRENCLVCHGGIAGLDSSHSPARIGCASCHGGDVQARDAQLAHAGMIRIPGNLADAARTCGQATCHVSVIPRVERSIMTTMAGVIEGDRRVFGVAAPSGSPPPTAPPHVATLGTSAADTHLRQLCASCHLGQHKTAWGPIADSSRGGACNACHLVYDSAATRQLATYLATSPASRTGIPRRHPSFRVAVDNGRCFGCHSRSARISTNYEGWHELRDAPTAAALTADARAAQPRYRRLDDGRYFTRVTPDAHQARGMDCIDCHTATEVMGAGNVVAHQRDQVQIRCVDCHAARLVSIAPSHSDAETNTLTALRGWTFGPGEKLGVGASGGVLANVVVQPDGNARLRHKRSGTWAPLRPPRPQCIQGDGHARLSCNACHTAWAPRCATCHTSYAPAADGFDHVDQKDVRGAWSESSAPFEAAPPTLGIRWNARDTTHPHGVVDTFIPGMILDLDRNQTAGGPPDRVFRRLYSRTFSHTIARTPRSCTSCHNDPVALGFGRGALRYVIAKGVGRWSFTPEHARSPQDGLPVDAWTGFLQTRRGMVSTRDDVRPFTVEEQQRILAVGACLTCHEGASAVMQRAITAIRVATAQRSRRCIVPTWP